MSSIFHWYGTTNTEYFKLTLNGVGVNVTLAADDVKIIKDGASPAVNVNTTPTAVDSTNMPGVYKWIPDAAEATCEVMVLNIKDSTSTGLFNENCLILPTGGHASSRFNGTG